MLKTRPILSYDTAFIGREDELSKIDKAINAWDTTSVMCYDGNGGIGKTRLLAEIYRRYVSFSPSRLIILEIIDFDDTSFHIPGKVEQNIAEALGTNKFEKYWRKLNDLHRMERAKVSAETLSHQIDSTEKAFIEGLNHYSTEKRVVLLFDTAEKQAMDETWENILNIIAHANNVFVVVAGREAGLVWRKFEERLKDKVKVETLKPLNNTASQQYLAEKQKKLRVNMDEGLTQGLLVLAQGHPILLDLAVEWMARDLPAAWIGKIAQEQLNTHDLNIKRRDFEKMLVGRIMEIRTPMDRLCLMLSRIYPLDAAGIAELLKMEPAKAQELFDEAQTFVFIKRLPGKRISLHDEMRRMVNEHVWPDVDKNKERQMHESKLIAAHLKKRIDQLIQKLNSLEVKPTPAKLESITQPITANLLEISALEREMWVLQGQYLEHLLFFSLGEGVKEFIRMFDEDSRNNPREILVNTMLHSTEKLSDNDRYEIVSRQIKLLHDKGVFTQVLALGEELRSKVIPEHKLDLLTKLANAKMALGLLPEAIRDLQDAQHICETNPAAKPWIGNVYNLLGMAHRSMGHFSEAAKYYNLALVKASSKTQTASILNNLGYVYALEGRYRSADTYCKEGLSIREKNNMKLEAGASLTTMGEIHRNWGKYKDALEFYNRALAIFEPENAALWLARLYSYRGAVYRLMDDYDQAARDLQKSIEMNVPAEKPWAYHVLGCVYWNLNDLESALKHFETSETLAIETHDIRTRANNLVGSAEIYFTQWMNSKNPELIKKINRASEDLKKLITDNYDFPHHLGRMQRVLADIAFEQKRYDEAMYIYAEAYATLGKRTGGYGKRTFLDEVETLSQKIGQLAKENPEEAYKWCDHFLDYWSDESRTIMRRDELISMCSVHRIEITIQLRQ
jgi:tetratricopeptide (TPR) repeat protein